MERKEEKEDLLSLSLLFQGCNFSTFFSLGADPELSTELPILTSGARRLIPIVVGENVAEFSSPRRAESCGRYVRLGETRVDVGMTPGLAVESHLLLLRGGAVPTPPRVDRTPDDQDQSHRQRLTSVVGGELLSRFQKETMDTSKLRNSCETLPLRGMVLNP